MSDWSVSTLGDLCHKITDGAHHSPREDVNGLPMFSVKDMKEQSFDYSKPKKISRDDFDKLIASGCQPSIGDILIAKDGSVMKHVFSVNNQPDYVLLSSIAIVKPDSQKINSKFLVYAIKSPEVMDTILNNYVSGSGVPRIVLKDFKKVEICYPDLEEQKAVASVLSSLDEKIDLLHSQNTTLEAMAETLFRQWFVEEIREEWEEKPLSFYGDIVCGKTPSKKKHAYFNGMIPFIKIPDMHGNTFIFKTEDSLTELGKNSQLNKTVPAYSICVSCIATVGLVSLTTKQCQTNQQINVIIPKVSMYRYFLYLTMKASYDFLQAAASGGTATLNLNTGNFSKIAIPLPPESLLLDFESTIDPIFNKIYENQSQVQTLEKLRDNLLPKLMSGEVRIKND